VVETKSHGHQLSNATPPRSLALLTAEISMHMYQLPGIAR
jgi:hypothetical protein